MSEFMPLDVWAAWLEAARWCNEADECEQGACL